MAKQKVIIIGLDGGTYKFIDPLVKKGKLPNIANLIEQGTRADLRSTIPPLTPAAWVSFMTGKNPGKHGFFDFVKYNIKLHDHSFTPRPQDSAKDTNDNNELLNSSYYAGQTIFDILGRAGYKIASILMPLTFPPWPVNGYMVSGFPGPDFNNPSTYPEEWKKEIGPIFDRSAIAFNNEARLIEECKKLVEKATDITLDRLDKGDCDILAVVYSSIDFAEHHLWKYTIDDKSPYKEAISEIYAQVDRAIGRIISKADKNTSFVILSDHGFCACPQKYFNLNSWLSSEGYLTANKRGVLTRIGDYFLDYFRHKKVDLRAYTKKILAKAPSSVQQKASNAYYKSSRINWAKTKAFRFKMGPCEGITINLIDRQSNGIVFSGKQYDTLRDEIIERLKNLIDPATGINIVREIYKREDLYNGRFVEDIPDIVLVLDSGYMGGLEIDGSIVQPVSKESRDLLSGVHDMDGILIFNGPKYKEKSDIGTTNMVDITPTILFDLGLPISEDMDGKVLQSAFKEPFASQPVMFDKSSAGNNSTNAGDANKEISKQEKEEIEKSLKGLGYLG